MPRNVLSYDFLNCARNMPALHHSKTGEVFDIENSEVAAWLTSQPDIMQKIFDLATRKGVIVYDAASKTWRGADR